MDVGSFTDFAEEKRERSYLNGIQGTAEEAVSFFDKLCGRKLKFIVNIGSLRQDKGRCIKVINCGVKPTRLRVG